jgi:type VI secretion system protein ImpA
MPLRDDLLTPIPGDNPSGAYLYYDPIYDKIKEARREDEDLGPTGVWQRERKVADWNKVLKLAGDALATKTKDLQIAAWLTEAYFNKEGFGSFRDCFVLLRNLMEQFWDTIYPEEEDGDLEFRATPLAWLGNWDLQIRMAPITKGGLSSVDYKVSRQVGYKADAESSSEKLEEYNQRVAEGKVPADDFDADFDKTPKKFYVQLVADLESCLQEIANLQVFCEERFGDDAPGWTSLKTSLNETLNTVNILLNKKREKEPDEPVAAPAEETIPEEEVYEGAPSPEATGAGDAPTPARKAGSLSAEPQSTEDAVSRIRAIAKYLRVQDGYSPAPYLLLTGFRFGELRASGDTINAYLLEPPDSELRQNMKKASLEPNWSTVLQLAEEAAGLPCGRGWLDLHRYAAKACTELGYYHEGLRKGIISAVRGLLADYPDLPKMTLMDDTPTANSETQEWLAAEVLAGAPEPEPVSSSYATVPAGSQGEAGEQAPPDAWELAQQALRGGRVREAIELIDREAKMERSGRGRFLRKTQLARIFIDSGNEMMALPILEQLAVEIDSRSLEDWEPAEAIAGPLSLLYRCLARQDQSSDEAKRLYAKLCRLDPVAAMNVLR